MKYRIRSLKEPGNLEKERVVIEILEDGDAGKLIISSTTRQGENNVSPKIKNPFWVPDQDVKKGDLVIVYTKQGKSNIRKNNDDTTSYFFYMGMTDALYDEENKTAAVFSIEKWTFARRDE